MSSRSCSTPSYRQVSLHRKYYNYYHCEYNPGIVHLAFGISKYSLPCCCVFFCALYLDAGANALLLYLDIGAVAIADSIVQYAYNYIE